MENLKRLPVLYPGWRMRLYMDRNMISEESLSKIEAIQKNDTLWVEKTINKSVS